MARPAKLLGDPDEPDAELGGHERPKESAVRVWPDDAVMRSSSNRPASAGPSEPRIEASFHQR